MATSARYLVVYDISEDKERDRVASLLEGFGFRVQKSVFECRLTKSGRGRLLRGLEALNPASGFVSMYTLRGSAKRVSIGVVPPAAAADAPYAFVP